MCVCVCVGVCRVCVNQVIIYNYEILKFTAIVIRNVNVIFRNLLSTELKEFLNLVERYKKEIS